MSPYTTLKWVFLAKIITIYFDQIQLYIYIYQHLLVNNGIKLFRLFSIRLTWGKECSPLLPPLANKSQFLYVQSSTHKFSHVINYM
jgi:hypothetical protein